MEQHRAILVFLPRIRDQILVGEQVVEHVRREHRLPLELLAEIVADGRLVVLLPLREVRGDLRRIEDEIATHRALDLILRPDGPSVRDERRGVAVDRSMLLVGNYGGRHDKTPSLVPLAC